jgi:transposase
MKTPQDREPSSRSSEQSRQRQDPRLPVDPNASEPVPDSGQDQQDQIEREEIERLSREELIDRVLEQTNEIDRLRKETQEKIKEIAPLRSLIESLRKEIEAIKRKSYKTAAPFSRDDRLDEERKKKRKRSGRRKGEGPFNHRQAPSPGEVTEPPIDVEVKETSCPYCGGDLVEERVDLAYTTELPERPRPIVKEYRVKVCRCGKCGRPTRGRHPDLAVDQWGTTAHRLGPRLRATAHLLHYDLGLPVRKVPEVLRTLGGVAVTQSALTQDALRQCRLQPDSSSGTPDQDAKVETAKVETAKVETAKVETAKEEASSERLGGPVGEAYEQLREEVKTARSVHTDDTGWRIAGETAFLMTFETPSAVVYQIRPHHTNEEVRELVPADYDGVMICDRGKSYDAKELEAVKQQKCLRHIDRSLVAEIENDPENEFARFLQKQLEEAHGLWRGYQVGKIDREQYDREGTNVRDKVTLLFIKEEARLRVVGQTDEKQTQEASIRERRKSFSDRDRTNRRLLEQIGRHHDRGNLLRFLSDPSIEPTNNRAERALRPAVIARKVSHCSKTKAGAAATSGFTSVIRTAKKAGESVIDRLVHLFRSRTPSRASP